MLFTSGQVRAARAMVGWSQVELALRMSVSPTTIRVWEAGGPTDQISASADRLRRLTEVLREAGVGAGFDPDRVYVSLSTRADKKRPR